MDYLAEIKAFYDWLITNPIHSDAQSLWYTLISIKDRCGEDKFTVQNAFLVTILGISNTQLTRARNTLMQTGRIKYKKRSGRIAGIYEVTEFVNHNVKQSVGKVDTKQHNKDPVQNSNPGTKPVLNYYKTKFEQKFKSTPTITYTKDGAIIKSLLNTYGEEKLKGLIDVFFESDDPFIKNSGYTIGVFKTVINKLLINNKKQEKEKEKKDKLKVLYLS